MVLIQLLLPVRSLEGEARASLAQTEHELTERFNGPSGYVRSPSHARPPNAQDRVVSSDTAVVEVVTDSFDREWWRGYARALAERFNPGDVRWRAVPFDMPDEA